MSELKRKLTAIMFTDMVGFTAMMQRDEPKTQKLVVKQRDIIKPLVEKHNGKVLQYTGDGTLCTFGSAIAAVNCAVEIQKALTNEAELKIRIGIHIGDIVFEGDDIYGDGVNVASRIEPLAEPGGICVSGQVYDNIKNQPGLEATSLGSKELKNVERAVEVFALVVEGLPAIKETGARMNAGVSIVQVLYTRRVPHVLGVYLLFSWGIIQLLNWLVNEYVLSPYLPDFGLAASLSLVPTILMLTYFHGKAGLHPWTKVEKIGIPLNLVAAVVVMFVIFQGKDLGAATKTVIVEDEEGVKIERIIPKSEFRKKVAIFAFENESGDSSLDWMGYEIPNMLLIDLYQDLFLQVNMNFYDRFKKAGYARGASTPLTLKRKIAKDIHYEYFVWGTISEQNGNYLLTSRLHETKTGKMIAENSFVREDIFKIVDEMSLQLKFDLDIPKRHIETSVDLPISEIMTNSVPALKEYAAASITRIGGMNIALEHLKQSVKEDPTFAYAYLNLHAIYMLLGQEGKRKEAEQLLMKHLYKLPEREQFRIKNYVFSFREEWEKAFMVTKMWADIYPLDITAHLSVARRYEWRGQLEESIAEY